MVAAAACGVSVVFVAAVPCVIVGVYDDVCCDVAAVCFVVLLSVGQRLHVNYI